jgi:hypothetical protein
MSFDIHIVDPQSIKGIERVVQSFLKNFDPGLYDAPAITDVLKAGDVWIGKYADVYIDIDDNLPPNVEARFEAHKAVIKVSSATYKALCDPTSRNHFRARFTLAHEISHVLLHKMQILQMTKDDLQLQAVLNRENPEGIPAYRRPEWQANIGGGAILMPEDTFRIKLSELLNEGIRGDDLLYELSESFAASIAAVEKRLEKLRIRPNIWKY